MELPEPVIRSLERSSTPYEVLPCDPEFADTAAFCDRYGYPPANSANTIVVASRRGPQVYAACVVAADRRLDVNRRVRRHLGVPKLSFAGPEETREITGMELGGVTVFGLPTEMPVLVDQELLGLQYVILGAGTRSAKIKAPPAILGELPGAVVLDRLST